MLKQIFINLIAEYTANTTLIDDLWAEVHKKYTGRKRYYHNLQHLDNLLYCLDPVKEDIQNRNCVLFTLFYHDIIYNPLRSDNEEKSAALAAKRMTQLLVPATTIELCTNQILATKSHVISADSDTNYFTDADLCILGQAWPQYAIYYKNVRKEYAVYPDMLYNPGRKKVLQHFLRMDRIFKTGYFYEKFEAQARQNLQDELALL